MKKLITITLAMFSSITLANTKNSQDPLKQAIEQNQPMAAIHVFNTSEKPAKLMEGNKLSRSKPRQVCIFVYNVPIKEQNMFVEYFQAPAPIKLSVQNAKLEAEDNQKNFLVTFDMTNQEIRNNIPSQCWAFTKNDPIGTYKLDVQFNDIVFKGLEFKLLK